MRNKHWAVFCIFITLFSLAGCGDDKTADVKDTLVKTQKVALGANVSNKVYSGSVRGRYETNMAFQVGGKIISRNVQLGDRVNAGDVLMVIDARDVVQQSNQGDAQVAAAKAQLNLAESNLRRYRELYAQEAISASVLDQYQSAYDSARSSFEAALAQSVQGHNAIGYTNLVAGANGVISSVSAEAGQVVGAGQTVLTLVQADELEVEINVPENALDSVTVGKEVEVSLWALKDSKQAAGKVQGYVREIAPMADNVTRTYKVRVSVPNHPAGMQLGMTASVVVEENTGNNDSSKEAVLPMTAIYQIENQPEVWVVDKETMTISTKKVTVEPAEKNQVKVTGLSDGDIVLTAGVHKVREGQKVRLSEDD